MTWRAQRPMTLEEKRQKIMRDQGVSWHEATRILAKRGAAVRHAKALARRAKAGRPVPVERYAGPRVVCERLPDQEQRP